MNIVDVVAVLPFFAMVVLRSGQAIGPAGPTENLRARVGRVRNPGKHLALAIQFPYNKNPYQTFKCLGLNLPSPFHRGGRCSVAGKVLARDSGFDLS